MSDIIRRRALLGATKNTDAHECIVEYEFPRSILTQQKYNPNTLSSKNITKVNWPEGITGIESYMFRGSSIDLNNVNEMPSTVTQIGIRAFSNCINIQGGLVLPRNLVALGDYAFDSCPGITAITLPSTDCAFGHYSLPAAEDINVSEGVMYMFTIYSTSRLSNMGGWLYNQPNGNVYLGNNYIKYKGTMPSNTNLTLEDGTLSIATEAFSSKSQLKSITIPDTVKFIGSGAFSGCTGLTSITIPKSLSYEVYEKIFSTQNSQFCESWPTSSTTNASVSRIVSTSWTSVSPFYSSACTGITTVNWNAIDGYGGDSSSAQSIFLGGGTYLPNVTTINFGGEVESIPDYLCYGLKKLTSITIPSSVEYIGCYAFGNCTGLTSITIPETVTELSYSILGGCTGITTINYNAVQPRRVNKHNGEEIGYNSYNNIWGTTSNLTTINIGNQVQVIPPRFLGSAQSKVTSIIIPNSVTTVEQSGFEQSKLTNISLPSVTSIETRAFYQCTSLNSIDLPSVTSIADYAFSNCTSLTSIDLPASITNIENYAFYQCTSLTSVTIRATNPPTLSTYYTSTFPYNCTFYVPASAVNTYKTTTKWSYFSSRIQAIPS